MKSRVLICLETQYATELGTGKNGAYANAVNDKRSWTNAWFIVTLDAGTSSFTGMKVTRKSSDSTRPTQDPRMSSANRRSISRAFWLLAVYVLKRCAQGWAGDDKGEAAGLAIAEERPGEGEGKQHTSGICSFCTTACQPTRMGEFEVRVDPVCATTSIF